MLIRGEAFRMGGCGTNESGLPAGEWSSILESIANRLVLPLQTQGYNVWVFGDIIAAESRKDEVSDRVKRALPNGAPKEVRVKPWRGKHSQSGRVVFVSVIFLALRRFFITCPKVFSKLTRSQLYIVSKLTNMYRLLYIKFVIFQFSSNSNNKLIESVGDFN